MELYQELRDKAARQIQIADHMLTMTYPMLQDNKILYTVAQNIYTAIDNAMTSVLEYERLFKKIEPYPPQFPLKLHVFREKIVKRYNLKPEHVRLLQDLHELVTAHRNSTMEFSRKEKFVIASESYELRTLSVQGLKDILGKAKVFINDSSKLTVQHDRIFK